MQKKAFQKSEKKGGGGGDPNPTTQTFLFTFQIFTKNFRKPSALNQKESSKQDIAEMFPGLTDRKQPSNNLPK